MKLKFPDRIKLLFAVLTNNKSETMRQYFAISEDRNLIKEKVFVIKAKWYDVKWVRPVSN